MQNIKSQKSEFFNSRKYAGSLAAHFDSVELEQKTIKAEQKAIAKAMSAASVASKAKPLAISASGALGNSAKSQAETLFKPVLRADGFVHAVDVDSGELIFVNDKKGRVDESYKAKAARFVMQNQSAKLLPRSRTSKCLRSVQSKNSNVVVHKSKEHGTTQFSGLQTCGSVWACPVCAAKISERRRIELQTAVDSHIAAGGSLALVTYTFPHTVQDNLSEMLSNLADALATHKANRNYKAARVNARQIGTIRALEVTHGQSGWHPHIHELWFLDYPPTLVDLAILKTELFTSWNRACLNNGLPSPSVQFGVDVQNGDFAASYVAKWGHEPTQPLWTVDAEISKAVVKKAGRGGRSPFQLLADSVTDLSSADLFVEYAEAFKGSRQLVWSRGLKARFEIGELSDDELAAIIDDNADQVLSIASDAWSVICRSKYGKSHNFRADILLLSAQNQTAALDYLQGVLSSLGRESFILSVDRQGGILRSPLVSLSPLL